MYQRRNAETLQLVDDIRHPTVSDIGHVFLEGDTQDADPAIPQRPLAFPQESNQPAGNRGPHRVVNSPSSENDFGVIAQLLRLRRQVVGIDTDAMTTHQSEAEFQ